jgi:hypothetical protein
MLYFSLVLSAGLLVLANRAARRADDHAATELLWAAGFMLLLQTGIIFLPALLLQAVLLVAAAAVWCCFRRRPGLFLPLACAATAASYGVVSWNAYRNLTRLQEQYAYGSMEDRLPLPRESAPSGSLPDASAKRLDHLEGRVEDEEPRSWLDRDRIEHLERLHEHTVEAFVNQPGFGSARMPGLLSEGTLKRGLRTELPLPQPGPRPTSAWLAAQQGQLSVRREAEAEAGRDLLWMHLRGVADFVHPKGFGYFKDRQHVAGFQPHQFSKVPEPDGSWKLQTLDLVGLVLSPRPVAYVSANLPRMDELREAPTRPLDDFEAAGLATLRRGEDLFVRDVADGLRALGSIRSTKQCLGCHGGQRGQLLGAFSYKLVRGGR